MHNFPQFMWGSILAVGIATLGSTFWVLKNISQWRWSYVFRCVSAGVGEGVVNVITTEFWP